MSTFPALKTDQERIVAALAEQAHVPVAEVATIYETERAALALGAHITTYLPIFATRKVQAILSQRALAQRGAASATHAAAAV